MCAVHTSRFQSPGIDNDDPDPETQRVRASELTMCSCSGNQSQDAARHAMAHEIHFMYLHL